MDSCCSVEYRTMVGCTVYLTDTLANHVGALGDKFFERGVISPSIREITMSSIRENRDKSRQLVAALTGKVRNSRRSFYTIVGILMEQGEWIDDLIVKLREEYTGLGGMTFPPAPGTSARQTETHHTNGHSHSERPQNHSQRNGSSNGHATHDTGVRPASSCICGVKTGLMAVFVLVLAVSYTCYGFFITDRVPISSSLAHSEDTKPGKCHPINGTNKKDLYKSMGEVGDWENVCLYLGVNDKTRNTLKYENLPASTKLQRCVDAYLEQTELPCYEEIVNILCNDLHKNVIAQQLAYKYGMDYQTICHPKS